MTAASDVSATDEFDVPLDSQALKATSVHGSILFGLAQIFKLALQVASQVALARLLFPTDFGLIAMVYPIVTFATIFADVGFGEAVVQRKQLEQGRVSTLFWVSIGVSCAMAAIVMGVAPIAAWIYREPRVTLLMVVIASFMPISALGGVQGALLARYMNYKVIVGIEVVTALAGTAVTVATALAGWSYWSLAAGHFAGAALGTALNWIYSDWRPSRPAFAAAAWDDLKFGGNITGFNLANFLTTSGDNIIVGLLNGQYALGLYDRSYRLVVQPAGQVLAPIGRVAIPLLCRLNEDHDEYRRAFLTMAQVVIVLTVPGMLTCVFYGHEIIRLMLGARWIEAGAVFCWIAVGGLTSGIQGTALWLLISQARMRGLRRLTLITAFLNLGAFVIGSFWGIVGVAMSAGLSYSLLTAPITLYGATRRGPVTPGALVSACMPFLVAGVISAVLLLGMRTVAPASALAHIVAALAIAYAVFIGIGLALPAERQKLLSLFRLVRQAWV